MSGVDRDHARHWRVLRIVVVVAGILAMVLTHAPALHLLGTDATRIYPARGARAPVAAVLLSGDMGLHFGMSGPVVEGLAARGIPVVAVSSPVTFAAHRTRAQALGVVEQAIGLAMRTSGSRRVVLIGQSFGADVVASVAPDLPRGLLSHIDAIALLVPGRDVYFRADPTGLAYHGPPDARPENALKAMRGPPVTCIYGIEEDDSLCPAIASVAAKVIALPGNHHLQHKPQRLVSALAGALHRFVPAIRP